MVTRKFEVDISSRCDAYYDHYNLQFAFFDFLIALRVLIPLCLFNDLPTPNPIFNYPPITFYLIIYNECPNPSL